MNVLCDLSLLQTLSSKPGWQPALNSGRAGAEPSYSMVMEELGERVTIVKGSRRR